MGRCSSERREGPGSAPREKSLWVLKRQAREKQPLTCGREHAGSSKMGKTSPETSTFVHFFLKDDLSAPSLDTVGKRHGKGDYGRDDGERAVV